MKRCCKCQENKSEKEFSRLSTKRLNSYCKACMAQYQRKRLYSIDYESLFKLQNGSCAICKNVTKLVVDHCHKTKQVRGLLCNGCNVGLGAFKDEPLILENAFKYLKSNPTR